MGKTVQGPFFLKKEKNGKILLFFLKEEKIRKTSSSPFFLKEEKMEKTSKSHFFKGRKNKKNLFKSIFFKGRKNGKTIQRVQVKLNSFHKSYKLPKDMITNFI